MDEIRIYGLEVFAHHGVYPEEREQGQKFILNAVLRTDTQAAGQTDDLAATTNYGEVCQLMTRVMQEQTWQLLEAAAEHTARAVLLAFPLVRGLTMELQKPEAPIPLPFETVSVKIDRGWHKVYVGIGSNMGDREGYLREAVRKLGEHPLNRGLRCSSLRETPPYGGVEQADFLNGALELETLLSPTELLAELNRIEREANRVREIHWGPRTLDLDILLYDEEIISTPRLTVPHIDMANRRFVLEPLAELNPYAPHPVLRKTVKTLLDEREAREKQC